MAFLSIESSNPNLSYIISKNPNNVDKCIAKDIRQGCGIGWFTPNNPQKYCVRFIDPPQEMSYSDKEYEYLDVSALSSPAAYTNVIREFFNTVLKESNELDTEEYITTLLIGFIECPKRMIEHFIKFFSDITCKELCKDRYQIKITSNNVRKSIHLADLLCLFMLLSNKDLDTYINEGMIIKYMKSIEIIKCPYFITHLFKVQLLKSDKLFSEYVHTLEKACIEEVKFHKGSVLDARKIWVECNLVIKNHIVDIGAGHSFNYGYLSRCLKGNYFPIDNDLTSHEYIERKILKKQFDNVVTPVEDWSNVVDILDGDTEVLLTEVLEHNTLNGAKELLQSVIEHPYVIRILITLPVMEFNQYYLIEEGKFRHDDHKWELTPEIQSKLEEFLNSFTDLLRWKDIGNGIEELVKVEKLSYVWSDIGDVVDKRLSPSKGLLIIKE